MDNSIARLLTKLKTIKNFSIEDIASLTGQSRVTVARHLAGEFVPDRAKREKYADAFGVPLAEFEAMWQPPAETIAALVRDGEDANVRLLTDLVRRPDLRQLLRAMDPADFLKLELAVNAITASRSREGKRAAKTRNK